MLRLFFEFVGQALPTFVATFIIFAGLAALLQPETQITDYFLIIRSGLLFGTVVWFFIAMPAFRFKNRGNG
jgi:putative exporter of polyketide antibiotics